METFNILALGDVVGRPGRKALTEKLSALKSDHNIDLIIANGENSAGGAGIDPKSANEIKSAGVQVITLGDHTWQRKEIYPYLDDPANRCIRPANYPATSPGTGYTILELKGIKVAVINIIGRVFTQQLVDCPFATIDKILNDLADKADIFICDFHAEATSEKLALAHYLDGRVSLLFGTHTHVQTADEQIFPKGMGYISDLGMCGPKNSVLGMDAQISIDRFITAMKHSYQLASGEGELHGIVAKINKTSFKTVEIFRINRA